ncbi:hypothetical protein [Candidatus Villigracilis affinis]|uniref:hypothetical protein n=1 Tax=Candidatus Villigracilis affinis TaxID=3140682 RepID=UPI002A211A0C|nr:hypothetical protein [Anaerolineales bacterium]
MLKKRKSKKKVSKYKPVFTNAEHKLMQNYGVGDLMDEVGVNRIMIVRTLDKMNQEMDNLTFKDHIDAMRAVSYTTGRIASLLDIRERLYKPYQEVKNNIANTLMRLKNSWIGSVYKFMARKNGKRCNGKQR